MRLGHPTHQKFKPVVKNALESGFFNGCQLFLCDRAKAKGKRKTMSFITILILTTWPRRFVK